MIDISDVNVGDRVSLSRANGDAVTFTVTSGGAPSNGGWLGMDGVTPLLPKDWDAINILERAVVLPTEPGFYLDRDGDTWFIARGDRTLRYFCAYCVELGQRHTASPAPRECAPFTRLIPGDAEVHEISVPIDLSEVKVGDKVTVRYGANEVKMWVSDGHRTESPDGVGFVLTLRGALERWEMQS